MKSDTDSEESPDDIIRQDDLIMGINGLLRSMTLEEIPKDGVCSALTTLYLYAGKEKCIVLINKIRKMTEDYEDSDEEVSDEDDLNKEDEKFFLDFIKLIKTLQNIHKLSPEIQQQHINKY